jgi:DNA repair exonuclease SbcCD ATPase subunit
MNEYIEKGIALLPDKPGCYLMHNEDDEIIYIGKAKNLKKRVSQYFLRPQSGKTFAMVSHVHHFETIITEALKYVTQSEDYEFVIQEKTERNKASYEFYIKTIVNGEETLQDPKNANGGGFIDIISVAAKYAYLELFNNPRIMNSSILLDEPGKMIDEQRSLKFAEYIKELGDSYNKQTIMITHNSSLADVADKTYYVSQGDDLISKVSEIDQVMLDSIESQVKEELDES